jgi:hypothetical protein
MSADVKNDGNNLLGVLTITEAGMRDNGHFKCVVSIWLSLEIERALRRRSTKHGVDD